MVFNEDKLQKEIIKKWCEFGTHNEVFKRMQQQIKDFHQKEDDRQGMGWGKKTIRFWVLFMAFLGFITGILLISFLMAITT